MLLRPRKVNHAKLFRLKKFVKYKPSKLNFGDVGLKLLTNLIVTSQHLSRYLIILKKITRKSDKTLRYFWLNFPVSIPFSEKAKGSRMGKGKGKVTVWGAKINSGKFFVEFKGLRFGRSLSALKSFSSRLPSKLSIHASGEIKKVNRAALI